MRRALLAVLLSLCIIFVGIAIFKYDNSKFKYVHKNEGIKIIEYLGEETDISIPKKIDGMAVTSIANLSFYDKSLKSVEIPASVIEIGDGAFTNNKLTSIEIPASVKTIGDGAFSKNRLIGVEIPSSVTEIGVAAFSGNKLISITIPDSVVLIGEHAFYDNELESVEIPNDCIYQEFSFDEDVTIIQK